MNGRIAFVILVFSTFLAGCVAASNQSLSLPISQWGVPMPEDVVKRVEKPGPDVPEKYRVFSGIWGGVIHEEFASRRHVLAVEIIYTTGGCIAEVAWWKAKFMVSTHFKTLNCRINREGKLIIPWGNMDLEYTHNADGTLTLWLYSRGFYSATLQKIYSP